jgi:CheY-like chemotaxis protein
VIEDHNDTRFMLVEILQEQGYDVAESSCGLEASQAIQGQSFDLIITDILLPNRDGLEVILEQKKRNPESRFLAISGGGAAMGADECLHSAQAFGAQKTLAKPFDQETFVNAVRELLDGPSGGSQSSCSVKPD